MKCPKHKDVELIMNALGGASGTWYHCWKCYYHDDKDCHGHWTVWELLEAERNKSENKGNGIRG